jgi:exonuclease III
MMQDNIIMWNVRGLNSCPRHDVVRELVASERPHLICLQETKLNVPNEFDVLQLLAYGFGYAYLLFAQTRGGIMLAWSHSSWLASNIAMGNNSITAKLRHTDGGPDWWLTTVYSLTNDADKPSFLNELREIHQSRQGP